MLSWCDGVFIFNILSEAYVENSSFVSRIVSVVSVVLSGVVFTSPVSFVIAVVWDTSGQLVSPLNVGRMIAFLG